MRSPDSFKRFITILRYGLLSTGLSSQQESKDRWPWRSKGRRVRWSIVIKPMTRVLNPWLANSYPRCGAGLDAVCPSRCSVFPLKRVCRLSEPGGTVKTGGGGGGEGLLQFLLIIRTVCDPHVSAGPNWILLLTTPKITWTWHVPTSCKSRRTW